MRLSAAWKITFAISSQTYRANEFKVSLLCPFESAYTSALRTQGCDVYIAPLRDDPPWRTIELICTLVRETGVNLIHAHLMNAHTVAAMAGKLTGDADGCHAAWDEPAASGDQCGAQHGQPHDCGMPRGLVAGHRGRAST